MRISILLLALAFATAFPPICTSPARLQNVKRYEKTACTAQVLAQKNCTAEPSTPTPAPDFRDQLIENLVTAYIKFHHAKRSQKHRLIFRVETLHPGLGDRLSSLITAVYLAMFTDRVLLIDWLMPYDIFELFNPNLIPNLKFLQSDHRKGREYICDHICSRIKRNPLSLAMNRDIEELVFTRLRGGTVVDVKDIVTHSGLRFSKAVLQDVTKLPHDDTKLFSAFFHILFKPAPQLEQLFQEKRAELKQPYISVHARLGSGVGEVGARFASPAAYTSLARCFAFHAVSVAEKRGVNVFYLATDTIEFRSLFKMEVKKIKANSRVITFDEVDPVHTQRCSRNCQEARKRCLWTILEFLVLAGGKAIVASKSSFSRGASWWGNTPIEKLIYSYECK